jgi:hypothetical protein
MILDEFGYLLLKEELAPFMYKLIAGRYRREVDDHYFKKEFKRMGSPLETP